MIYFYTNYFFYLLTIKSRTDLTEIGNRIVKIQHDNFIFGIVLYIRKNLV
jgi:hypothetical protein